LLFTVIMADMWMEEDRFKISGVPVSSLPVVFVDRLVICVDWD